MSDDRFFDRLRRDTKPLRYEPDDVVFTRVKARIRARIEQPSVSQFLASWFRPLAASLSALALAATIGFSLFERSQPPVLGGDSVDISMAGDVYSVAE
ncbi:MAG TPA: hypothetical protein VF980_13275 [Thermoanaerobaculia bacterium]